MKESTTPWLFLAVLVAATSLGPLAMQIFLPSLPAIQADLGVPAALAQMVFSLSMAAIAISMLVYGPLSDRFGRRPVLIVGLALFMCGSLIATVAPGIGWLIVGRTIQAIGGAGAMAITRTMVRDIYGRERSAAMIAYLTMAMVVAPMLAPAIGGYLNDLIGWRANFAFVGLVGIAVTVLATVHLRETHTDRVALPGIGSMIAVFGALMRMPTFRGFAFHGAFSIATFFSFAAGAPYVVIVVMGEPASVYGAFFIIVSAAFMVGNFAAGKISERVGIERMVLVGSWIGFSGTVLCLICILIFGWTPSALFIPGTVLAFGNGLAMPNSMAGAISVDPRNAGAASGLMGFLQMLMAAVFAQLAGMWQNGTPYPLLGFMIGAALLAVLSFLLSQGGTASAEQGSAPAE